MKRVMMAVVAMLAMAAFPAAGQTQAQTKAQAGGGAQVQAQVKAGGAQAQAQAKAGTCDGTQKRLHAQDGMKQQLRSQAKAEGKGQGHMFRGGRGGR
ncbi:MAG: hypothetical protein AB1938_32045 [Myxococcota bacterium]